jgi:V/A-type H+-transporting ATPase subunit B
MKDGIGKGRTHADHPALAAQLYATYSQAQQTRVLAGVVGEDGLSEDDRKLLLFGDDFEQKVIHQGVDARTLEESMAAGWSALQGLRAGELHRLDDRQIREHLLDQAPRREPVS